MAVGPRQSVSESSVFRYLGCYMTRRRRLSGRLTEHSPLHGLSGCARERRPASNFSPLRLRPKVPHWTSIPDSGGDFQAGCAPWLQEVQGPACDHLLGNRQLCIQAFRVASCGPSKLVLTKHWNLLPVWRARCQVWHGGVPAGKLRTARRVETAVGVIRRGQSE